MVCHVLWKLCLATLKKSTFNQLLLLCTGGFQVEAQNRGFKASNIATHLPLFHTRVLDSACVNERSLSSVFLKANLEIGFELSCNFSEQMLNT